MAAPGEPEPSAGSGVSGLTFPDLDQERARLQFARQSRGRMIERLQRVDPQSAADEFTAEYVEVTVQEALDDLAGPGTGDFFGRIDTTDGVAPHGVGRPEQWYIGRRHIEDDQHDPVIVDWRAPVAAPFYRATAAGPGALAGGAVTLALVAVTARRHLACGSLLGDIRSHVGRDHRRPDHAG